MFDFLKVFQHTFWRAYFIDKKRKYIFFSCLKKKNLMSSFKLNLHQTYKGTIVQHLKMFWCNCWCKIWTNLKICTWGWSLLRSINTVPFFWLLFVIWNLYDLSFVSDAIAGDDNIRLAPSIRSKRGQWWSFNNVFLSNFFCFVFYLTRWIIVWKVNFYYMYLLSEQHVAIEYTF